MHEIAGFYEDSQAGKILKSVAGSTNDFLLTKLLEFESDVVFKANDAIKEMQKFLARASGFPSKAVVPLAKFAADISTAFNQLIGENTFGDLASFRAVAQVVFAEASLALSHGLVIQPRAMLTLDILNPGHSRKFQLPDFLKGELPASADVAVAQRLVNS